MCEMVCVQYMSCVCTGRETEWEREESQCLSVGSVLNLLELFLFTLSSHRLCNVETERALAQNAELVWLDVVQYQDYHGVVRRPKHTATLFIHRKMKNLEQTVPAFSAWKIIWSGNFSVFFVLSTQTPYHTSWPHVDLTTHFEADLHDGLLSEYCLGSLSSTLC